MTVCTVYKVFQDGTITIPDTVQTKSLSIVINSLRHRVDRVLGFFSSRPNWDPPTHSSPKECVPLPLVPGVHTRLREKDGGVPIQTRGQTLWYSRYEYISTLWSERKHM
jgi:hypothetical protein